MVPGLWYNYYFLFVCLFVFHAKWRMVCIVLKQVTFSASGVNLLSHAKREMLDF